MKPSRSMKQVAGSFGGLYAGFLVQHVQPITPANEGDMSSDTVPSHHSSVLNSDSGSHPPAPVL